MASPEQLRHYGHMLADLAAEMAVNGADPMLIEQAETARDGLLMAAVRAEHAGPTVEEAVIAAMERDLSVLAHPSMQDWPYRPTGRVTNGIEELTGRFSCCGAQALLGVGQDGRPIRGAHFDHCPNATTRDRQT